MQTKSFVAVLLVVVVLVTSVYSAYQFGSSKGYKEGFSIGSTSQSATTHSLAGAAQQGWIQGNATGYLAGFQAGLAAQK